MSCSFNLTVTLSRVLADLTLARYEFVAFVTQFYEAENLVSYLAFEDCRLIFSLYIYLQ
jgi:hypothetical protein